jgi:2-methylisocitrate lyase-like PEP mutase family enzyme
MVTQQEKAEQFYKLHHTGKLFILPNIWDALGAKLLESLDYQAIATASASIAYSNGFDDGENIPFETVLLGLKNIVNSTNLPVTADVETCYATDEIQLEKNIKQIIATGVVGINIEDTNHNNHTLNSIEVQSNRIKLIKKVAEEMNVSLFINARTDVLLYNNLFSTSEAKLSELIKRGKAYKEAGANCFFPIAIRNEEDIKALVNELGMPINILALPGIPDFKTLNSIGVARVSLGPGFLKYAIKAMKSLATELKEYNGLSLITENEITSDYLKSLIHY